VSFYEINQWSSVEKDNLVLQFFNYHCLSSSTYLSISVFSQILEPIPDISESLVFAEGFVLFFVIINVSCYNRLNCSSLLSSFTLERISFMFNVADMIIKIRSS